MSKLIDLSTQDFVQITSSDAPAPGGGSIAALAGSLGAALAEMVGRLTVGREKYASSEEAMQEVIAKAQAIKEELLIAIDKDSDSFNRYMDALSMPKNTEEEKALRREAMQEGLKEAARVPLATAEAAAKIFPLAELAVTAGNPNAVTDAMVATMMARSAVYGAVFNVRINLSSIKDMAFVDEVQKRTDELVQEAMKAEEKILVTQQIAWDCFE